MGVVAVTFQFIAAPCATMCGLALFECALEFIRPIVTPTSLMLGPGPEILTATLISALISYLAALIIPHSVSSARWAWVMITLLWSFSIVITLSGSGLTYTFADFFNPPKSDIVPGLFTTEAAFGSIAYSLVAALRYKFSARESIECPPRNL